MSSLNTPWFFYIHIFDLHAPIIVSLNLFLHKKFGSSKYEKTNISNRLSGLGKLLKNINLEKHSDNI